ncbi:MAG: radical SAM protein [Crenarchaeota archaeon]|nr:radical SAM protein [Thermoproteota archaeon]
MSVARSSPRLSLFLRGIPEGCRLCMRGSKLVIFLTGVCPEGCFYCPISPSRMGRRLVFADEERVEKLSEILEEADAIGAEGASFTGGEPLLEPRRIEVVSRMLKDVYGDEFHIHLYTGGSLLSRSMLRWLSRLVDEVRVHPRSRAQWEHVVRLAEYRGLEGLDVSLGVEVPVIPGRGDELVYWIRRLDSVGVDFVNLNELEWAPHTATRLREMGFRLGDHGAVEGSWEEAVRVLGEVASSTRRIMVHYCSSLYKDRVQLRMRNYRKALRSRRGYEVEEVEGLVAFLEPGRPPIGFEDYCSIDLSRCWPCIGVEGCIVEAYPSRSRLPRVSVRCRGSG